MKWLPRLCETSASRVARRTAVACLSVLVAFAVSTPPARGQDGPVTDEEIQRAIEILRGNLYRMQDARTGGWFGTHDETPELDDPKHDGGLAVLATYALLASGESPEINPDLAKALTFVEATQREHWDEVDGTYVVGLRNHIWPLLPREVYGPAMERDTQRLIRGAGRAGTFSYLLSEPPEPENWDHSTTQYGVLGLWEAAKVGLRVPDNFWERTADHFIETQFPDGGWSYRKDNEVSESMTCAGLTVLCIAQQQLERDGRKPNARLQAAIDRGLDRLDAMFDEDKTTYGGSGYFIYSVERVGLATGRSRFGSGDDGKGTDWFDNFARYIIKRVNRPSDGVHSQVVNSSFFLMFLSRGAVPVFINKLSLEGTQEWNNRPNDIYFLAKHLSDTFEQELNWKVIPLDWELEHWLGPPLSYLSIEEPIEVTDEQAQRIKQYLDLGGLLFINPEGRTPAIVRSVNGLIDKMYPGKQLERVADDHPALNLWKPVPGRPKLSALNNGVRDLILVPEDDWGLDWQRGGRNAERAYIAGGNLFLYTSGYRRLEGRSSLRFPQDPETPKGPAVTVAVTGPDPDLEPRLWEHLRRTLGGAGGADLTVVRQPLESLGENVQVGDTSVTPDLVHVVGFDDTPLPDAALDALDAYTQAGGTVLIENLGGRGTFASTVENQITGRVGAPSERLSRYEPLFEAGPKGTADISRVTYRAFSVRNYATDNKPRLVAFRIDDRPAILVSGEDLSLAALGVRHWNLHGYSPDSARQLLTNIVLHAKR